MTDRSAYYRQYYQENRERIRQRNSRYYRENEEDILDAHRQYRLKGRKTCPKCGETIAVWQSMCNGCKPVKPKLCRRCGLVFTPDNARRKVCDVCLEMEREEGFREAASSAEPCTKCKFLFRCRREIRQIDGWPLCWVSSPHREEFLREYLGEVTLQGSLARTLRDAIQGGYDDESKIFDCADADAGMLPAGAGGGGVPGHAYPDQDGKPTDGDASPTDRDASPTDRDGKPAHGDPTHRNRNAAGENAAIAATADAYSFTYTNHYTHPAGDLDAAGYTHATGYGDEHAGGGYLLPAEDAGADDYGGAAADGRVGAR